GTAVCAGRMSAAVGVSVAARAELESLVLAGCDGPAGKRSSPGLEPPADERPLAVVARAVARPSAASAKPGRVVPTPRQAHSRPAAARIAAGGRYASAKRKFCQGAPA